MAKRGGSTRRGGLNRIPKILIFVAFTALAIYLGYLFSQILFESMWGDIDFEDDGTQTGGATHPDNTGGDSQNQPNTGNAGNNTPNPNDSSQTGNNPDDSTNNPDAGSDVPPVQEFRLEIPAFTYYHIQVGAFKSAENAMNMIDELKNEGIGIAAIRNEFSIDNEVFYQVIVDVYADEEVAKSMQATYESSGLPVLVKTNSHEDAVAHVRIKDGECSKEDLQQSVIAYQDCVTLWTKLMSGELSYQKFSNQMPAIESKLKVATKIIVDTRSGDGEAFSLLVKNLEQFVDICLQSSSLVDLPPTALQHLLNCIRAYNTML